MSDNKKLVLVFQQGGKLRNSFIADSYGQINSIMNVFYSFPFYSKVYELNEIPTVQSMIQIMNHDEVIESKLDDCEINLKLSNDCLENEMVESITLKDSCLTTKHGKELSFAFLDSALSEMNECPECDEGTCEVGPSCNRPASVCCGGCFTYEQCESCDGSGLINTNL